MVLRVLLTIMSIYKVNTAGLGEECNDDAPHTRRFRNLVTTVSCTEGKCYNPESDDSKAKKGEVCSKTDDITGG